MSPHNQHTDLRSQKISKTTLAENSLQLEETLVKMELSVLLTRQEARLSDCVLTDNVTRNAATARGREGSGRLDVRGRVHACVPDFPRTWRYLGLGAHGPVYWLLPVTQECVHVNTASWKMLRRVKCVLSNRHRQASALVFPACIGRA